MKLRLESIKNRLKSYMCEVIKKIEIIHKLDYDKIPIYMHDNIRLSSCQKEPDTVVWLEGFKKDDVAFDVGANVGAYSLIMAKYAKKVYSFEPSAFTFGTLVKNIYTNKASNIVPLNMALSQHKKLGTFAYSSSEIGGSGHSFDEGKKDAGYCQEIFSYSIDELVYDFNLEPPNHIKLDVDGIELKIIKGASKTISGKDFKSLMVEATEQDVEMFAFLDTLNLQKKAKYDIGGGELCNYLFVKKK